MASTEATHVAKPPMKSTKSTNPTMSMKAAKASAPPKAMKSMKRTKAAKLTVELFEALKGAAPSQLISIRDAAQNEMEAAQAAKDAAEKEMIRPSPDTTVRPPDDAVWWFADTRCVKSVWAVAWLYKGKIQQVMYKED